MRLLFTFFMAFTGLSFFGCADNLTSRVAYVDIHYIGWDILTIRRLSCYDLARGGVASHITVTERQRISELVSMVVKENFKSMPDVDDIDTRVCCLLKTKDGETLKEVSFAHYGHMMIDDKVYETDTTLFKLVLSFLPDDYLPVATGL